MASFQNNKKKNFMHSRAALSVLGILVILLGGSALSVYEKSRDVVRNKRLAEDNLESLKKKQAELKEKIDGLKTDAGMEEAIRDKYRAVKEGEGLIVIVDENASASGSRSAPPEKNWWQAVKDFFTYTK